MTAEVIALFLRRSILPNNVFISRVFVRSNCPRRSAGERCARAVAERIPDSFPIQFSKPRSLSGVKSNKAGVCGAIRRGFRPIVEENKISKGIRSLGLSCFFGKRLVLVLGPPHSLFVVAPIKYSTSRPGANRSLIERYF